MFAEIITIGDEILIGQIIDTNSAWIAQQLNHIGIRVHQITSISDKREHIEEAVEAALSRADLVITTGGLGPTRDDITKRTLADYFGMPLVMNNDVLKHVESLFAARDTPMPEVNRYQALVPEGSEVIYNHNGTAPGMWFPVKGNKVLVSMPGVPYEMKGLVSDTLLEKWQVHFNTPSVKHRTILTQGVGESNLMGMIDKWEDSLKDYDIKLAYLPSPGVVRLRLSVSGENEELIEAHLNQKVAELKQLIPELIFGYGTETMEEVVGNTLLEANATMASAESCTGGYLAHLITRIPGSSRYYKGSIVAYDNQVKVEQLDVFESHLQHHGAVSEEVVRQMAEGVRKTLGTDYGVATSGIAGPDGGTDEKPVGTVWMAVSGPNGTITQKRNFGNHRERNIRKATLTVLNMLRKEILRGY
jgi:nicotinamide-nucleotide amidase